MKKMTRTMKKSFVLLLAVLLAAGLFSMAGCGKDDPTGGVNGSVISESSAMEEGDSQGNTANEDAGQDGDALQIDGELDETEKDAFVMPAFDDATAKSVWTTADVKFRSEPNTDCDVIKVLKSGTELQAGEPKSGTVKVENEEKTPSEIPEGWLFIKYEDTLGFVSADYVTEKKPAEPSATSKVEAIPGQHRDPNNIVVCIDPGHQGKGDSTKEPNGPGSSTMKARVTSGTSGVATGVDEYVMNLEISLMLRDELENRGYTVYMTRTTHDINISNMERAQYSTQVGADIAIRVHCNSVDNSSVRGAETMAPSSSNPYVSHLANASQSLSRHVIDQYCAATGFKNRGVQIVDNMTGINWSEIPVTSIELGFMSNPEEDVRMQDPTVKNNMVQGMANGIDAYFGLN